MSFWFAPRQLGKGSLAETAVCCPSLSCNELGVRWPDNPVSKASLWIIIVLIHLDLFRVLGIVSFLFMMLKRNLSSCNMLLKLLVLCGLFTSNNLLIFKTKQWLLKVFVGLF